MLLQYNITREESANKTDTVVCENEPGYKMWVGIVPRVVRVTGWAHDKTCTTSDNLHLNKTIWVTVHIPLIDEHDELQLNATNCHRQRLLICQDVIV